MFAMRFVLAVAILPLCGFVTLPVVLPTQAPRWRAEVNSQVKPGEVTWQPNFAAACQASKDSGKPVLLFQLLGRLDAQFC